MSGRKLHAQAVVIEADRIHEGSIEHGSNYDPYSFETWRFVVEVRPAGVPAYRVGVEQKIAVPTGSPVS